MSGLTPPPGWNPPQSSVDSALPPPPAFKMRKIERSSREQASSLSDLPQNDEPRRKRKRRLEPSIQPPEKLRNIIEKHRTMASASANADKRAYLGALKYLPHAIFKLLENIPQPWEAKKEVDVLYHTAGAITFVNQASVVDPTEYMALWGQMWESMRDEKRDRTIFRRMKQPPFDDEEPPMTWKDLVSQSAELPEPVLVKQPSTDFQAWQQAQPFILNREPPAGFDYSSFVTSKALHSQVPNGPRFEDAEQAGNHQHNRGTTVVPGVLSDPQRIIVRPRQFPVRVEAQVTFPHLHGSARGQVEPPTVGEPVNAVVKRHDHQRGYFADASVTKPDDEMAGKEEESGDCSSDLVPFLADFKIDESQLAHSLEQYHAVHPFDQTQGVRKLRRAHDVTLVKQLYMNRRPLRVMAPKTRRSYQRLLKAATKLKMKGKKLRHTNDGNKKSLLKLLGSTKFFDKTRIDWLEAGMQLCHQGYQILQLFIHRRGLHFMHLDHNFNLKPTKTLTTKERKRSRFGNSFHLTRELLKMVKLVVDSHIHYRLGNVDAFELADGLHYIFTHMGQLTGIYRYKYRVMHQITACNDIKHVIYDRFNMNGVGKGPGCGIWQPSWRVWLAFLRGSLPMLERWLGNLISRQFFGRVSKGIAKTITKQRVDSHYDLELRASVLHDILDVMPEQFRKAKTKVVMQHLSEAWRCWKANIPWNVPGMPEPIRMVIERYIQSRAEHWIKVTHINRERIRAGGTVDKAVARKNLGRLTRLWLRAEQSRQTAYAQNGPYLSPQDAVVMYKTMASFLQATVHKRLVGSTSSDSTSLSKLIPFPGNSESSAYANDTKFLTLALENLRSEYNMTARLTNTQREELLAIEQAYDNPYETLSSIKSTLKTQRVFKNIEISLLDFHSHLCPVYHVDASEKIVDAYLDQYLWYEAEKLKLFPQWIKPSDDEVAPIMVRKFCSQINDLPGFWSTENYHRSAILHLKLAKFVDNADFTLLNQLLKLIMDGTLADYITAKMNASLSYKDMSHLQQVGIIRGLQFSSFVVQYYLVMVDVLLLGLPKAIELANEENADDEHPVRSYVRNVDDVYLAVSMPKAEAEQLIEDFAEELEQDSIIPSYPLKTCWPRDKMMRLVKSDVDLGRALYEEFRTRIPENLGTVTCEDASIYSVDNPALFFEMAGFEMRLEHKSRRMGEHGLYENSQDSGADDMWLLSDPVTGEHTGFVSLRVSDKSIDHFNNRCRQILMSSGSTTFAKIVKRWNTALTAMATYFREAVLATPRLLDAIVKNETRVQTKVKMGLNSKMPARFPPCVFYSPDELGGLGMLSASHILIPDSDLYGKTTAFRYGMDEQDEALIPNIFRYINSWDAEATDSKRVWLEYAQKRADAIAYNSRVSLEDLEEIWDRGLPRISTLFQKDRSVLAFDKGFRVRQAFRNYSNEKYDPFWWVNSRHDGRLWNFSAYRTDVIEALGGIQKILEHSLFKATGFEDWEGLFWQKQSGFEQQMQMQKLTNAQRAGLSQIPNRRFTLWWSPTINRANVYVGFLVQLDLTGIFLHGKIPTLKISYIQIFRAHLWQKIHESLVVDMCQILDREQPVLAFETVEKLPIHPRKSYRMNASTADILLKSSLNGAGIGWALSRPSSLSHEDDKFDHISSTSFWIDIQLRYGDYDSHDITRYARAKFLDYTSDGVSLYPSKTGLMICVDLAYNTYDAYGYWFPGLKPLIRQAMAKLMQSNPALFILRERIRKALQLYQSQPRQPHLNSSNYTELLTGNNLVIDDTAVYRTTTRKTKNGNMTSKPVNGALFAMNPQTGKLHMKLIHAETVWAGQKKLSAVSKWKAAEEVANLLRAFAKEDLPQQVIINTRGLRDPMEVNMLEFSDVSVRNSEFSVAFSALLQLPQFKKLVDSMTADLASSKALQFNLYDDWMTISQPSTAFSRLMLLLRGLLVDPEATSKTLQLFESRSSNALRPADFVWPKLDREAWIEVEEAVSDIIVDEYCRAQSVNRNSLTQSEIRDIILGQQIVAPSEERQRMALDTNKSVDGQQQEATAITTKTHNIHGDEITVVTTSKYEQQQFESKSTWQSRALEASSALHYRALTLEVAQPSSSEQHSQYSVVIPRNLVSQFTSISDVRNMTMALIYGKRDTASHKIEVVSFAVVPQLGSATTVAFSPAPAPADLPDGDELELLGVVRSSPNPRSDRGISPIDLMTLASRSREESHLWDAEHAIFLTLNSQEGSTEIQAFEPTAQGIAWGGTNRDLISEAPQGYTPKQFARAMEVSLVGQIGYFYTPQDDIWNFAFMSTMWNARARAFMKIGIPRSFYDALHRPIHFSRIGKLEDSFNLDDF